MTRLQIAFGATAIALLLASPAGASEMRVNILSQYSNDHTFVAFGVHGFTSCQSGVACGSRPHIYLPTDYDPDSTKIFLSGFGLVGDAAQRMRRINIEVSNEKYDPKTGRFEWDTAFDFETEHPTQFNAFYSFTLLASTGETLAQAELDNQCSSFNGQCTSTAVLPDGAPVLSGGQTDFLGFAMKKFELRTTGGEYVTPGRLEVDLSNFQAIGTDVQQDLWCTLFSEENAPAECEVRSVGISAVDPWYDTQAQFKWANIQYPVDWYVQPHAYPGGAGWNPRGLFTGLRRFDISTIAGPASSFYPLKAFRAGCFGTTWDPVAANGGTTFVGLMAPAEPPPINYSFDAYIECLTGWMGPPF